MAVEQKKEYQVVKEFKGLNTKNNRTALQDDEFAWLENAMPIGFGNIKVVPTVANVANATNVAVTWANTVTQLESCNLNLTDYIVAFQSDGRMQAFNLTSNVVSNVAPSGTFSGSGVRAAQWKNERLLIIDPTKGYYSWNGNNVVFIGTVGAIGVVNGGSGYTTAPAVVISAPNDANGTQATAVASLTGGAVSLITITEPGTGYNAAPTVTLVGGGGNNAQVVAGLISFATGTVFCTVESGGTGYTNAANITVTITGGGGANAAGKAVTSNNAVSQIIMTNPGTGYTSNPTVAITGGGGSNAVVTGTAITSNNADVATFSGRSWIAQGRTVYYSAAGSYNDYITTSAGNVNIADSTLHGNILWLLSANNFLYLGGEDSINVFSDVRVTSAGLTLFTNTNVSASVGSKRLNAIFPYFRSILIMNDYGVYALVGSTTSKVSDPLDGIFPLIDFTQPVFGGQVLLNNILCAAFNFTYNDPILGARKIQAVFFEKKWFITSQGTINYLTSVPLNGIITLFGSSGTNLVKLYADATSPIPSTIVTALWPLGDPIRTKQALKVAVEATAATAAVLNVTIDSEKGVTSPYTLTNVIPGWLNNNNVLIPWLNNANAVIGWTAAGYQLLATDAQQWGKYLGMTATSNTAAVTVNTFEMEHELRARF